MSTERYEQGVMARACNPSTQVAETGVPRVSGQPGLYNKTLSKKKKEKEKGKKYTESR
jgi:hypothetical protein